MNVHLLLCSCQWSSDNSEFWKPLEKQWNAFWALSIAIESYLCSIGLDQLKEALDCFLCPFCCNKSDILLSNGSNSIGGVMECFPDTFCWNSSQICVEMVWKALEQQWHAFQTPCCSQNPTAADHLMHTHVYHWYTANSAINAGLESLALLWPLYQ